jgi:hypothetical protein
VKALSITPGNAGTSEADDSRGTARRKLKVIGVLRFQKNGLNASGYMKNWEVRLKKSTGEGFWANVSATKITFDGEDSIFVALMDVTERKELERKLVELARFDSLTRIFARGYFGEQGDVEV